MKVAIVDDNPADRDLLCEIISSCGIDVDVFSESAGIYRLSQYDVVVVDRFLAAESGLRLAEKINSFGVSKAFVVSGDCQGLNNCVKKSNTEMIVDKIKRVYEFSK